jgi:glycerophosphoryl diester phosphodiesterase
LQEIHLQDKTIKIGVLTETDLDLAFSFAKVISAYSIHPYYHLLTTENIKPLQEKFKIYTWTVNEPEDITFVKSLNVDGIITDFLDRV